MSHRTDAGLLRPGPDELYYPTVALAIEIVSPGDETWDKLPFYAAHEVDELLIVDPAEQTVRRRCGIDVGNEQFACWASGGWSRQGRK